MEKKGRGALLMDKYEVGCILGRGSSSKVYKGRQLSTNESVAIKVMDKDKTLINREISVMRHIRHPNVIKIHEVMTSRSKIYLAMEYAKGGELFHNISRGARLPEDTARRYFQQLISAVDFCHTRGVYHLDLKPENLLLDHNGNLKVSDFGLSGLRREDGLLNTNCGTPAYVAPEVINGKGYDGAKVDIWSCGVVLFVLLAGYLPFHDNDNDNDNDMNRVHMYRKISKGRFQCPKWFPPQLKKLLSKILHPRPRSRITLAKIMDNPWFKNGSHKTMNAFEIISSAPGLNLSRLFEEYYAPDIRKKGGRKGIEAGRFEITPSLHMVKYC